MTFSRRSAGAGLLILLPASVAAAQAAPRKLSLVEDQRIEIKFTNAPRDFIGSVSPSGRVIVSPRYGWGEMIAFDSSGKQLPWKIPLGRRDQSEIAYPARLGWIPGTETMWVVDPGFGQIALVDANGKVVKSLENPSWIHPTWGERRKYPVFGSMNLFALYADTSMLVIPERERHFLDTPGYDHSKVHLLRTTNSGAIQRTVAQIPALDGDRFEVRSRNCAHTTTIPFAARTWWTVSPDGRRIFFATPGRTAADSGTIQVTALSERGDTLYSKRIWQPAVRVPQATVDAFLSNQRACGDVTAEAMRDSIKQRASAFWSFLMNVQPGIDGSLWVIERPASDSASQRIATVLDERGDVVGTVTMPVNQPVIGVDRAHLWTMEIGRLRAPSALVRYRIDATGAPPPRSAKAGTPSGTSRPPG